jgi:Uncharacterised protein conserved in bacteria (DUF2336)
MRLASDVEAVALPILTDSPVLTEDDLIELIDGSSSSKQEAIAGRADVSERVADALTRHGSEDAVATLLANTKARVADASRGTVIGRFADSDRVKTTILIHDAGHNGLTSLYEQTGMPSRLLPAVRVALDVVHGTELDGGERDQERYRSRVITRILTRFEDLPQEDLDYLLDKLGDVLTVTA